MSTLCNSHHAKRRISGYHRFCCDVVTRKRRTSIIFPDHTGPLHMAAPHGLASLSTAHSKRAVRPARPAWIVLAFVEHLCGTWGWQLGPNPNRTTPHIAAPRAAAPIVLRPPLATPAFLWQDSTSSQTPLQPRTTTFDDRPPRDDALRSPRLGALTRRQGARLVPLGARIGDHGRSRRRTRSAAARSFELRWQLVCPPAPPVLAQECHGADWQGTKQ